MLRMLITPSIPGRRRADSLRWGDGRLPCAHCHSWSATHESRCEPTPHLFHGESIVIGSD